MHTTLYHNDLAKEVGAKINKPATKTKRLILCFEELIASELKSKERVKLQNFGTFYLIHQNSRHIIQIRTKQRRILIGTTLVKFRPSQKVKKIIGGRDKEEIVKIAQGQTAKSVKLNIESPISAPKLADIKTAPTEQAQEIPIASREKKETAIKIKVETSSPETPRSQPDTEETPTKKEYERVDGDKIRAEIKRRLLAIKSSSRNSDEILFSHHILETSLGGKVFALAFKRIAALGEKTLGFYIVDEKDFCQIYFGKPRKKLARIPKQSAIEFLCKHLELDIFDFPQERFVKLYLSSKMDVGWIVFAHTLPLAEGTSVYVKLVKKI